MTGETLSKTEFAEFIGISPGRVSQLIKSGQISPASLVGDGRRAQIIVERAQSDLKRNLDPAQSLGLNGMRTRPQLAAAPSASAAQPSLLPTEPFDTTADLIGREKLKQAEIATRRAMREEALETGRYVLADEARAAIGAAAAKTLATFEAGLTDMADAVAADHGVPPRDVLHTLMKAFRTVRENASRAFAAQRDAIRVAEEEIEQLAEGEDDETEVA